MTETMGNRIKQARLDKGMKQYELAEAIGVNFTAISLYESNKREPRRDILEKISLVTNVSADYLMGLSEHKTLNKEKSEKVSQDVADLMAKINKLDPEKRKLIESLIDSF